MVEVMKIMATSFKRSHACTATLSAPNRAAGHHQPMPLPETPENSQASLNQSLMGSQLLSPGSWCTKGSACVLAESVSQSCASSGSSMVVNGDLLQEGCSIPRSTAPRAPAPAAVRC